MQQLYLYGLKNYLEKVNLAITDHDRIARILSEHTGKFELITTAGLTFGVTGKTFRSTQSPQNWPKVGDWVSFEPVDAKTVKIVSVLPRFSTLERLKPIGHDRSGELPVQVLAANVDILLLVLSMEDLPSNSKFKALLNLAKQVPKVYVLLNKTDLVSPEVVREAVNHFAEFVKSEQILPCSIELGTGVPALQKLLRSDCTVALIGPSGTGKSSLTNTLMQTTAQKTGRVQTSNKKGRHTTTHRELFLLPSGVLLIDTPGLRDASEVFKSSPRAKVLASRKTRLFKKRKIKLLEKDSENW